jgi:hypothetical protein
MVFLADAIAATGQMPGWAIAVLVAAILVIAAFVCVLAWDLVGRISSMMRTEKGGLEVHFQPRDGNRRSQK